MKVAKKNIILETLVVFSLLPYGRENVMFAFLNGKTKQKKHMYCRLKSLFVSDRLYLGKINKIKY